jgi:hypothetical protein
VSETDREFCTRAVASLKRALPVDDQPDITLSHRDSPVLTDLQNGLLVLLCQWLDLVVEIIGFFKKDSFLKNHVISIRYSSL